MTRWIAALALVLAASCGRSKVEPPLAPADSMKLMKLESGYRIAVFAAEPAVVAPVAMEWDEDGRVYVVEDPGYPLNVEGKVGKVKLLTDTNGDGLPDKSTVFSEGLTLPTGVMRWKKGILVTDAPDLLYFEDTDGDGKADVRRAMLTGFALTNPQHTVNSPVFGLVNWIHIAHENPATAIVFADKFADRGSDIRWADREGAALKERGRSIRFRPDTGEMEARSGTSQFGHAFDEWGHYFTLNNTIHARHEAIAARYLRRNPDLAIASSQEDISSYGRPAKVLPIAQNLRFEMLTNVGEFTSACGFTWFRGGAFIAEPAHNLVHRALVKPAGATFSASRENQTAEFLASADPWFRPVNFSVGPDGAIYLLDYYRLVIEHPEWMSAAASTPKDLNAGNDRGRIYRITPPGGKAPSKWPRPGDSSPAALVAALGSDNAWERRTAQRLLMDRRPAGTGAMLEKLAQTGPPPGRVHARWTLEGLGALTVPVIERALLDETAGVRENAIILAEPRLAKEPALAAKLASLADDADAHVRFQLLCTLGSIDTPAARAARDVLLDRDIEDRWVRTAALSASPEEASRIFARSAAWTSVESKGRAALLGSIATITGARRKPAEVEAMLARVRTPGPLWIRAALVDGLASGLKQPLPSEAARRSALALFAAPEPELRAPALRLLETLGLGSGSEAAVAQAAAAAADNAGDPARRADSISLLGVANAARHRDLFAKLLDPKQPEAVQAAAVRALGRIPGEETGKLLLGHWREFPSAVRGAAADALYRDPARIPMVLDAVEKGRIQAWTLGFRHRRQVMMHRDPALRATARKLFEPGSTDRAKTIETYKASLSETADLARGRAVFEEVCAKCHRFNGKGAEVGPDLATVRHQPKQVLLEDILDPNRAISQGFEAWVVETATGSVDGVIAAQTETSITLRREEGKQDIIARKDIARLHATELSAMPGDLDKQIDPRRMNDVIEYIKRGQ